PCRQPTFSRLSQSLPEPVLWISDPLPWHRRPLIVPNLSHPSHVQSQSLTSAVRTCSLLATKTPTYFLPFCAAVPRRARRLFPLLIYGAKAANISAGLTVVVQVGCADAVRQPNAGHAVSIVVRPTRSLGLRVDQVIDSPGSIPEVVWTT